MDALARNDGRRTTFRGAQYLSLFERARLPTAAQSRAYVTGRRIFLPVMVKSCLALMETTIRDSRDPEREKAVTVSPRDLLQTDMWL